MISMRTLLSLAGLSAVGLPLVLFACAPVERTDPPGSGGSSGSGGSAAGPTTGTSTGAGGSGGSVPVGSCTKAGQAFTVMGTTELDGTPQLDDKLYLVPDVANRAMVHVIIEDKGMNRLLVRSLVDAPSPLGNFTQFAGLNLPSFRPSGAKIIAGSLHVRGTLASDVSQLIFPLDPDNGVGIDGSLVNLPTPIECLQGGHPGKIVFAPGTSPPQYLVSCIEDPPGVMGRLFHGDGVGAPTTLVAKEASAPEMAPQLYTFEGGNHLVIFGGDKGGSFFSQGPGPSALGALQPLKLTAGPTALEGVFATVPLPADAGVTLIAAFFDATIGKGKFLTGPVLAKDYATLAKIPAGNIAPIEEISKVADVAPIFFPTWDATGIFGGGASTDSASARFYWFTRDGKPLVFGQSIYASPGPAILAANAASLGNLNKVVVWIERDDGASPPRFTVKGQKLICQIKS